MILILSTKYYINRNKTKINNFISYEFICKFKTEVMKSLEMNIPECNIYLRKSSFNL